IKQYNDGYCYILTVIDVFPKKAWAEPVKNKSGLTTATAFESILKRTKGRKPQQIETDNGKEFYNKEFRKVCENHDINHFSTTSSNKASTVERFNRTLKTLLYRYFTANNTYRWLNVLHNILQTYNSRWHRSIRMSPNNVTNKNEKLVYKTLYAKKPKFGKLMHKGDKVRISKKKQTFEKGYLPNFTEEVFKISNVTS
ncbi:MAG: DDE-type integrase/transposase/recombinase, partial [Candidatus Omnitrophica bacterium]|nr:DDE-type integrase/transposase/recombinase [Candidatus Omnitrophota bacterium]